VTRSHTVDPRTLALEPDPLDPGQVLAGAPEAYAAVLDVSADGRVERGVWEISEGVVADVEADELFVVLSGRATVEVQGGPALELAPGTVGLLRAGDRTVWHVHERLRKVFQITGPPAPEDPA
jgi:uncharacterized cupin superfamily protein